jgi:hypothetical protein
MLQNETQLPNGLSIGSITVTPKNWQTKLAKINTNWFISYRFYDPSHAKPKQVMIKGMNYFKTLLERQTAGCY